MQITFQGYGRGKVKMLDVSRRRAKLDDVELKTTVNVVPNSCQHVPVLIVHPFTEQDGISLMRNDQSIHFSKRLVALKLTDHTSQKQELYVNPPPLYSLIT